jgi:hypothetical protein
MERAGWGLGTEDVADASRDRGASHGWKARDDRRQNCAPKILNACTSILSSSRDSLDGYTNQILKPKNSTNHFVGDDS